MALLLRQFSLLIIILCVIPHGLFGHSRVKPISPIQEALSETVPFTFPPNHFAAEDFRVQWVGDPIEQIEIELGHESFQWVRATEILLLPRAQITLRAKEISRGLVSYQGAAQSLAKQENFWEAKIPVVLWSNQKNALHLEIERNGKVIRGTLGFRFSPRPKVKNERILFDPSCSQANVAPLDYELPENNWIYVGCRLIVTEGAHHAENTLELHVYWDGLSDDFEIDGTPHQVPENGIVPIRLSSSPGITRLTTRQSQVAFSYQISDLFHAASLGLGVGPYQYQFEGPGSSFSTIAPLATLYGSYFLSETLRVVAFGAAPLHGQTFGDLGLYVNLEQSKFFDRRFTLKVLLGAHGIIVPYKNSTSIVFGGPQGMEVIFNDFAMKSTNLSLGAFLYPLIDGKAYTNVWLRWGTARYFGELNYIFWKETINGNSFSSSSLGLSVGAGLFQFL